MCRRATHWYCENAPSGDRRLIARGPTCQSFPTRRPSDIMLHKGRYVTQPAAIKRLMALRRVPAQCFAALGSLSETVNRRRARSCFSRSTLAFLGGGTDSFRDHPGGHWWRGLCSLVDDLLSSHLEQRPLPHLREVVRKASSSPMPCATSPTQPISFSQRYSERSSLSRNHAFPNCFRGPVMCTLRGIIWCHLYQVREARQRNGLDE